MTVQPRRKKASSNGEFETVKNNLQKNPDHWVTADEPMTSDQATYLKELSDQAGEEFDATLSKAQASKRIDQLQTKTGRGRRTRR